MRLAEFWYRRAARRLRRKLARRRFEALLERENAMTTGEAMLEFILDRLRERDNHVRRVLDQLDAKKDRLARSLEKGLFYR